MNHVDDSLHEYQLAVQTKRTAERWLSQFEAALTAQDAGQIGERFQVKAWTSRQWQS